MPRTSPILYRWDCAVCGEALTDTPTPEPRSDAVKHMVTAHHFSAERAVDLVPCPVPGRPYLTSFSLRDDSRRLPLLFRKALPADIDAPETARERPSVSGGVYDRDLARASASLEAVAARTEDDDLQSAIASVAAIAKSGDPALITQARALLGAIAERIA